MKEGSAVFEAAGGKVSKRMGVFYNPIMSFNRSITVVLLNSLPHKKLSVGLPMAATGVRGIRILKEVGKPLEVWFNDNSQEGVALIKKNLKQNKLVSPVSCEDGSEFLLGSKGFSYIDVDPFGSPNPFLDAAVKRLARSGVLGVTATDTAPLAGTYPKACLRKYWAMPLRNEFMHETGLRILIRKVQLVAAQYERALIPVFSYYKDHYYRVFFRCEKSKQSADKIIKEHGLLSYCPKSFKKQGSGCSAKAQVAGPLWLGSLWELKLVKEMLKNSTAATSGFLKMIEQEARVGCLGFYELGAIGKRFKLRQLPSRSRIIEQLQKKGYKAAPTHFSPEAFVVNTPNNLPFPITPRFFAGL